MIRSAGRYLLPTVFSFQKQYWLTKLLAVLTQLCHFVVVRVYNLFTYGQQNDCPNPPGNCPTARN
jgi:hypothetical protein